jgi:hypothetical protein
VFVHLFARSATEARQRSCALPVDRRDRCGSVLCCAHPADSARTAETRKRQKLDLENKLKETEEAVKMFSKKVGESASTFDCSI